MKKMNKGLAIQILEDEYGIDVDNLQVNPTPNGIHDLISLLSIAGGIKNKLSKKELLKLRDSTALELFNNFEEDFKLEGVELQDIKDSPADTTDSFLDNGDICFDLGYISAINHCLDQV
jgi:hypothetical protein